MDALAPRGAALHGLDLPAERIRERELLRGRGCVPGFRQVFRRDVRIAEVGQVVFEQQSPPRPVPVGAPEIEQPEPARLRDSPQRAVTPQHRRQIPAQRIQEAVSSMPSSKPTAGS